MYHAGTEPGFPTNSEGDLSGTGLFPVGTNVTGQFLTTTVTYPDGTTFEFSHCEPIVADSDGDNIQDDIDTIWNQTSHDFDDGAGTFGSLIEVGPNGRNGCFVSVVDMPDPPPPGGRGGVAIGAACQPDPSGSGFMGPATVSLCGNREITVSHATSSILDCTHSLGAAVGIGPVDVKSGTITARLRTATTAVIGDPDPVTGSIEIQNDITSPPIWVGGLLIDPGATVTVRDTDSDAMADAYETAHDCLDFEVNDAAADPDHDGVNNLSEAELGTDPCVANAAVGGIAELPDVARLSDVAGRADSSPPTYAVVAAGVAAAFVALAGAVWYARRRRLT